MKALYKSMVDVPLTHSFFSLSPLPLLLSLLLLQWNLDLMMHTECATQKQV